MKKSILFAALSLLLLGSCTEKTKVNPRAENRDVSVDYIEDFTISQYADGIGSRLQSH